MHRHRSVRAATAALIVTVLGGTAAIVGQATAGHAASAAKDRARQRAFTAAAREFHVPERLLLAVSYARSRWDDHGGHPSTTGAYGPMALVGRPSGAVTPRGLPGGQSSAQSLDRAARLIHASPARLRTDPAANVRGGAALLAAEEKKLTGGTPAAAGEWYAAVARFSGSTTGRALAFANDVYATLRSGASRTTVDGQRMRLGGGAVTPDKSGVARLRLAKKKPKARAQCPASLDCRFVPAAYKQTDPNDPGAYGNYDTAKRPHDLRIRYIVIHDTEESYSSTLNTFTNPASLVSAHYVIRSSDGQVTQMVRTRDVAWQAGNWYINSHSIGIEHEGFEAKGATWFTEPMYRSSARLVRYLAHRFDIPMDRGHVIGHNNVPATGASGVAGMHTDPGPFWDWRHYMNLLHHRNGHPARYSAHARQVEIAPDFDGNRLPVTSCSDGKCTKLPSQGTSFVYLRTKPSDDAPLLGDPKLHPGGKPGTTEIQDWGDRASAGQKYAVADRKPGWTGIWYAGRVGWFRDSPADPVTRPAHARTVTPRGSSAATYGVAYPPAGKFPKAIPAPKVTPLPYKLKKGQRYTVIGKVRPDYYYAKTIDSSLPSDHTVVRGGAPYYAIQLGHRIGYVRSADVRMS